MFIEHQSDRNMTGTGRKDPRVDDMIDLQKALVAAHIAGLEHEAAALRAERARADTRAHEEPEPARTELVPLAVVTAGSPRVRLGRWLVSIGTAIAGTTEPVARAIEDCAADTPDTLSHAA